MIVYWSQYKQFSKVKSAGFTDKLYVKNKKREISRDIVATSLDASRICKQMGRQSYHTFRNGHICEEKNRSAVL